MFSFRSSNRKEGRFSLLLLDEGEFYVKEFVATCQWPSDVAGNWRAPSSTPIPGQLRLCTKSLFFEPDDIRIPIVRLPFQYLEQLEGIGRSDLAVVALRWYKMKGNAADEPYVYEKGRSSGWTFSLTYAALADFMPLAQRMLVASRLPPSEQETMLQEVLHEAEGCLRFDHGHLRSPSVEAVVLEVGALRLAPLQKEPCRLALTNDRLYMQPLHNISGDEDVMSHPLAGIAAVARRRSGLKDVGLELFFIFDSSSVSTSSDTISTGGGGGGTDSSGRSLVKGPVWGSSSAFFAFHSTEERDGVREALTAQLSLGTALPGGREAAAAAGSVLEAGGEWLPRVTAAWQHGRLSNFEYLLYCNLAAGRSFNDLTQYPIFPWILQQYDSEELDIHNPAHFRDLSKPIGALNPTRLAQYRERYRELESMYSELSGLGVDPPFMYGTHYSCPGYTLFWLVRAAPAHMLRLQAGKFDAPDRLFCSIAEAWDSVLTNPTDVKELIPEFYMPERQEFLVNSRRLALGLRQDGRRVGDVTLPPWAHNSPEQFLRMHAEALESPYVSSNLHHWIDLIFGVKQRGMAALAADNVFRHLTYEGAIDPESISDVVERAAVEVAINEFGQCPHQIFLHPHPRRRVCPGSSTVMQRTASSPTASAASAATNKPLSLALVSAIVAALDDEQRRGTDGTDVDVDVNVNDEGSHSALLEELDVVATRRKQHGGEKATPTAATAAATTTTTTAAHMMNSPFTSAAAAKEGLMGRWNALKGALEEVKLQGGKSASGRFSGLAGSISTKWASATSGFSQASSTSRKSAESGLDAPQQNEEK